MAAKKKLRPNINVPFCNKQGSHGRYVLSTFTVASKQETVIAQKMVSVYDSFKKRRKQHYEKKVAGIEGSRPM